MILFSLFIVYLTSLTRNTGHDVVLGREIRERAAEIARNAIAMMESPRRKCRPFPPLSPISLFLPLYAALIEAEKKRPLAL